MNTTKYYILLFDGLQPSEVRKYALLQDFSCVALTEGSGLVKMREYVPR